MIILDDYYFDMPVSRDLYYTFVGERKVPQARITEARKRRQMRKHSKYKSR